MELFKESKKQPIKFRGFKFIGYHQDFPAAYYYKPIGRDNFELMECMLEGFKKPEVGAGTNVKVIDAFMSNYLKLLEGDKSKVSKIPTLYDSRSSEDFIKSVIKNTYDDFKPKQKELMLQKFTSVVPNQIYNGKTFQDLLEDGYKVLYCSNDESEERVFGIVNIVMVKEENIFRKTKDFQIDRKFTIFKPLQYRVTAKYIKKESRVKYAEDETQPIVINHELLK